MEIEIQKNPLIANSKLHKDTHYLTWPNHKRDDGTKIKKKTKKERKNTNNKKTLKSKKKKKITKKAYVNKQI